MAWRPHQRASINPNQPSALGSCDRCGIVYNLKDLVWQYDYRGNNLVNIKLRVCRECLDVPYQGLRPIKLPPDPLPVKDARPLQQAGQEGTVSLIPNIPTPVPPPPVDVTQWDQDGAQWDEPGILWDEAL